MMKDVRVWQGVLLVLVFLLVSCQTPMASDRAKTSEKASAPSAPVAAVLSAKEMDQAKKKIASLIRDVLQRMQDDGVTSDNVATRSTQTYSTPFVKVDAAGRVHTIVRVKEVTPDVMERLKAAQVQDIRHQEGHKQVHGWIPFDRVVNVAALSFVTNIRPPGLSHIR